MLGSTLRLGRVFGIELRLDYTWLLIFLLVTWSLAGAYFPMIHPGWPPAAYWLMGGITALLFFASVVAHELAHSFVSQSYGVPVRNITLFIFGGAARMSEEPKTARGEFLMALAGPATNLAIAALFGLLWLVSQPVNPQLHALAGWLARINVALGLFNLIPGFPLDGGRVFRATVWSITGNLRRATVVASGLGRVVAYGFVFFGIWQVFRGNWADGLWIAFIGWFLVNAATASYRQLVLTEALAGHTAREVMMADCPQVPRRLTLDVLVDQVILSSGRRCFPVVEQGHIYGLVTLQKVKSVPRERWTTTRVGDVMLPQRELEAVRPDEELSVILRRMADEDVNQFPVMEDGQLLGMVGRDNVLAFLRTLVELDRAGGAGLEYLH